MSYWSKRVETHIERAIPIDLILLVPLFVDSHRLISLCIQYPFEDVVHLGEVSLSIRRGVVCRGKTGVEFGYVGRDVLPACRPVVGGRKVVVTGVPVQPK